jgi:hypothetical protein
MERPLPRSRSSRSTRAVHCALVVAFAEGEAAPVVPVALLPPGACCAFDDALEVLPWLADVPLDVMPWPSTPLVVGGSEAIPLALEPWSMAEREDVAPDDAVAVPPASLTPSAASVCVSRSPDCACLARPPQPQATSPRWPA